MTERVELSVLVGEIVPEPVSAEVIDAVQSLQVTVSAGSRSGFQVVFAVGKSSVILKRLLPGGYFNPPRRIVIVATINGTPMVLIDGVITRHELAPSDTPGASRLTITGEDLTRMMDLIDFSGFPFPAMPAEARVAILVAKYAFYGIIPLVIPSVLLDVPNPVKQIPSQRGTDLAYITSLARNVGYVFYLEPGPRPGMNTAYWGPEIKVGAPQPALIVNSDAASNVDRLTFSFDGFQKTLFVALIHEPITKLPIPIPIPDVNPLQPPLGRDMPSPLKLQPLAGLGKYSPIQAAAIGLARAAQSADVISGSGTLNVARYGRVLKARQLVEVRGAGEHYDGTYFVKSVTHNVKPGQYTQNFNLSRNAFKPL
jgi:hypothetical protein